MLLALSGAPAIPELRDIMLRRPKRLRSVIVLGTLITVLVTAIFAFSVIGASSGTPSDDAISGLASSLGSWVIIIGSVAGFLAVATSFLVLGLNLKEQFLYDLHKSKSVSFLLALGVPFLAFLFLTRNFIAVIGFAGAVFTALDSALLVKVWLRCRRGGDREPEYKVRVGNWLGWLLVAAFALGAIYEILQFLFKGVRLN
jgi:hypothetical protein